MASRIVQLAGGFADRQAIRESITEGLFHLQSGSNYGCYTKRQWYPNVHECDVVTVQGESRVVDRLPDEPTDRFRGDSYWVSDYIVVLDKPDTELFWLAKDIPTYPAEAGMAHGITAVGSIVAGFAITAFVAWLFGAGSWSVVLGGLVAAVIIAAFMLEMRVRIFFAGLFSAYYVRQAVRRKTGARVDYLNLVAHLSKADHPIVAAVSKQTLRWI